MAEAKLVIEIEDGGGASPPSSSPSGAAGGSSPGPRAGSSSGDRAGGSSPGPRAAADWEANFIKKNTKRAGDFADYAGNAAVGLARNSTAPAIGGAIEGAAAGLSRLGPYGMAAGVALQSVAKVGTAASEAIAAFVARGRELSGYSSRLAGASAEADVRSMMGDVREANDLGPQLATLIEQQSKLEVVFREIMLPLKEWALGVLNSILKTILDSLLAILEFVREKWPLKVEALEKAIKRIHDILNDKGAPDLIGDLLKQAGKFVAPALPAGAGGPPAMPELNIPIVKGL